MPDNSLFSLLTQLQRQLSSADVATLGDSERTLLADIGKQADSLLAPAQNKRHERAKQIHFEYALNGIIESSATGIILDANPAAESIFQQDRKSLIGTRLQSIFAASCDTAFSAHFQLLAEQGISHAELPVQGTGEQRELTISSIQVDEDLFLHVLDDVTEDRQRARDLLAARHAAEEANAAKGQFLANVSHEIRTPMNGIIGLTQLALMTTLTPLQRDYLDKIAQSGRTLLAMLNDLLDFSKIEAGKLEFEARPFDLFAVMDELSVICAHSLAEKPITVIFDIAPEIPRFLLGDQLRLTQILINVLGNALKFTEQGQIILTIDWNSAVDRGNIRFSIADTGCGIAPDALERLFQPFSQADAGTTRRFGGTGLGLAISRQFAHGMGGSLTIASTPGHGSTFTLSLPLPACEPELAQTSIPVEPPVMTIECACPQQLKAIENMLARLGGRMAQPGEPCIHLADCPANEQTPRLHAAIANNETLLLLTDAEDVTGLRQRCELQPNIDILSRPLTPLALLNALWATHNPAPAIPHDNTPDIPTEFAGACVAVAEDITVNQQVICGLLERAGIQVVLASNGRELIDLLARQQCQPELILMDVHMPEMDGLSATRALRAMGFTQPVIALSAGAGKDEQSLCLDAGMSDFLGKPIDLDELWGVLTCWLPPRQPAAATERPVAPADQPAPPGWLVDAGIDVDTALARFLGNVAALENGVQTFCGQHAQIAENLTAALARADHKSFVLAAHGAYGGAANIGADALAALCREAEKLPATSWQADAPGLITAIDKQMQSLCRTLNTHENPSPRVP
jgi:two-component system, sensor histidine kinase and response regulator